MPELPNQTYLVSRYIYYSKYIKKSNLSVSYGAFMPNPMDNTTSVFKVSGLSESDIWQIAELYVTPMQSNTLKGRADINSGDVESQNLDLIPDKPPDRHINISGWKVDKSENKLIAKELANKSICCLVPKENA